MLTFLNLHIMLQRRKLFLIPMIVAFVASIIGTCFILNFYASMNAASVRSDENKRAYTVELDGGEVLDAQMAALIARPEVVRVFVVGQDGNMVFFANAYGNPPGKTPVAYGNYFTEESYQNGLAQVVLAEEIADEKHLKIGDDYELCGQSFRIIGIGYEFNGTTVPYAAPKDHSSVW